MSVQAWHRISVASTVSAILSVAVTFAFFFAGIWTGDERWSLTALVLIGVDALLAVAVVEADFAIGEAIERSRPSLRASVPPSALIGGRHELSALALSLRANVDFLSAGGTPTPHTWAQLRWIADSMDRVAGSAR